MRSRSPKQPLTAGVLVMTLGLLIVGSRPPARATPLENTHYGGVNVGSVVVPHPASILKNPAVIGLLPGTHVFLDGTLRVEMGRVHRSSIRSDTGNPGPGATQLFEPVRFAHLTPDLYFGLTTDLGSSRVVIGIAVMTPFAESQRFPSPSGSVEPSGEGALRYHRLSSDWYHLFVSPVVAVKLHKRVFVGLGMSYVRSMLNMSFVRDRKIRTGLIGASAPLFEDPAWTERVDVDGTENSFCFNVGLVIRLPKGVDVGVAYRSKVVGVNQDNIKAEGSATVRRQDDETGEWSTLRGRARTVYEIPDSLSLGVNWAWRAWDFGFGFEWVRWSVHRDLNFTLTGNEFRAAGMANWGINFVHYRGFQDVFRGALSAAHKLKKSVKLAFGSIFESSAVPKKWVSAAAIDSHKLDLWVALVWRPHKSVGLHLGYSMTLAPDLDVSDSGYDPGYVVRCVEDRVDILWSENCRRTTEGKGLPTASGRYWQMVHRISVGVSYDYW